MIKIIKKGDAYKPYKEPKTITCLYCDSVFETNKYKYEKIMELEYVRLLIKVKCPVCKNISRISPASLS